MLGQLLYYYQKKRRLVSLQPPFCFSDNAYFTFTLTLWGRRPLPETDKVMLPLFMDERNTTSARPFHTLWTASTVEPSSLISALPKAASVPFPCTDRLSSLVAFGHTTPCLSTTSTVMNARSCPSALMVAVEQVKESASSRGNFVIGHSEVDLTIYDSDGKRIVRTQETNIGDFCTDALRHFTDADIALVNGGGIRSDIMRGEIPFNDLYDVMPFGDMIATGTLSGQQLLDVLEFSVSALPAESGTFMQVSGLCFEVNPNIPSAVVKDIETGNFTHIGDGDRRVCNVKVLEKQSGEYKAVELSRQYTIATLDYLILEQGGSGILNGVKPDYNYWGADIEILRHYLEYNLGKTIGSEYSKPQGRIIYK